jgi:hypothetical protein
MLLSGRYLAHTIQPSSLAFSLAIFSGLRKELSSHLLPAHAAIHLAPITGNSVVFMRPRLPVTVFPVVITDVVRIRRELRKARRLKDAMRLQRELKQAQIECGYAQHWVMLT